MRASNPAIVARMILPDEALVRKAKETGLTVNLKVQAGGLAEALASSNLAIASTGTVTLECALFGIPTVAIYKASWIDFQIGKRIVKIKYLAMPNILANEQIFPEFIQDQATAENIASAGLELLRDEARAKVKARLAEVVASLGGPGASRRAARAIVRLLRPQYANTRQLSAAVAA
jgi:lipid-A-disaccharide synthase